MTETKRMIYDKLCRVLTEYEDGVENADGLYEMLAEIQNKWEDTIIANN